MIFSKDNEKEREDIDFEPEDELGSVGAAKAKMQKLKDELEKVKAERHEYLDGWQRSNERHWIRWTMAEGSVMPKL